MSTIITLFDAVSIISLAGLVALGAYYVYERRRQQRLAL